MTPKDIEDRPGGNKKKTEARPAMEEKEVNEGVKEEPGLEPRSEMWVMSFVRIRPETWADAVRTRETIARRIRRPD